MRILITGATGFIGRHLVAALRVQHQIEVISRQRDKAERLFGEQIPALRLDDLPNLDGYDAIINLAGEPIADRSWSAQQNNGLRIAAGG